MKENKYEQLKCISFVIPVYNEQGSLHALHKEITEVMEKDFHYLPYEILYINDGSTDNSGQILEQILNQDKNVKLFNLSKNCGKSMALSAGFKNAQMEYIVTMDSDGQDDPHELYKLFDKILEGAEIAVGYKEKRKDSKSSVLLSRIGNTLIAQITDIKVRDMNTGFKVIKRELVQNLKLVEGLHRYIPLLVDIEASKIVDTPVIHRPRTQDKSKYTNFKYIPAYFDLLIALCIRKKYITVLTIISSLALILYITMYATAFFLLSSANGHLVAGAALTITGFFSSTAVFLKLKAYSINAKHIYQLQKILQ